MEKYSLDNRLNLLKPIEHLAREAGEAIMQVYARAFVIETKSDSSPLTEADLLANERILKGLKIISSEIPVLSEEAVNDFSGPNQMGCYWLVDPLDGTKEFIQRSGEFTVNIALIENGKPVLGVVYAPVTKLLYSAVKNQGAYKRQAAGPACKIQVRPKPAHGVWTVVGSRSHGGDLSQWLSRLGRYELKPVGSSLKFCLVAEGEADLYPRFGPTSLWDTAAAQIIVEEAGGQVIDLAGKALDYSQPQFLLNPAFLVCSAAIDPAEFLN